MKKTITLFLALIMAFSITATAVQGDAATEPPVEIRQYEIITFEQLLAGTGYTYLDISSANSYCYGAISKTIHDYFGKEVGEGSISLFMNDTKSFYFRFNVIENPDFLEKDITIVYKGYKKTTILTEETLKDVGYTLNDVRAYCCFGNIVWVESMQCYASDDGEGKVLVNMDDDKAIMLNVTVEDPPKTISDVILIFFIPVLGPILAIIAPAFLWPLIFTPLFTPFICAYGIAELVEILSN